MISSGIMGMINGSAVANVATTGAMTIPVMKRQGYPARFAGAVEAAAASGGQIMPPIMGAGAFVMAEVEVNVRTGVVRVRRVVAAHDVGKVLNPVAARGQVEGAVVMGVGFALTEEFVAGVTRGFAGYRIPTTHDVPEIETIFVERPDPKGPFGAKGLGECALIPTAPAILNAVADATGVRITRLPATRQRVLEALARATV